jgi:hypothetical protein
MIWITDGQKVTVWATENKGKYTQVQMSSSKKDKATNSWVNSSWSFVRFVGEAHTNAEELKRGDRIVLHSAAISHEPYDKGGVKTWANSPQLVVFKWEFDVAKQKPAEDDIPF